MTGQPAADAPIAPDVTFVDTTGREEALRDYRGRPVLLVFLRWLG